jgi:Heavy-metal resistance
MNAGLLAACAALVLAATSTAVADPPDREAPGPAVAQAPAPVPAPGPLPATPEDIGRALEDLAGMIRGLGSQWRDRPGASAGDRPLITLMLNHRADLGLSPAQVEALERLRADFGRDAAQREADIRGVERDLAGLLAADPVDLARVEAALRRIERSRADLRLGRIRTIEQGKAQLTPEQLARFRALADPARPRAAGPGRL